MKKSEGSNYLSSDDKIKKINVSKFKFFVSLIFVFFITVIGSMTSVVSAHQQKAEAFDWTKWIMCSVMPDPSKQIYQWTQTSDPYFKFRSKSSISGGIDNVEGGLNWILNNFGPGFKKINEPIIGYSIDPNDGTDKKTSNSDTSKNDKEKKYNRGTKVTPFDRFGVAGLHFTGYIGEWKYLVINACADESADPQDPKANLYYEERLEPQSTWENIPNSNDVRTKQFSRGIVTQLFTSFNDVVANWIFNLTKTIVVVTIGLISLSFTDIINVMGIDKLIDGDNGIFNILYNGIFAPLVFIAFAITGIVIFWNAVVKRRYRESLRDLIRSLVMFIIAIVIAASPLTYIQIPNKIAVTIQSVILTTMNSATSGGNGLCSVDNDKNSKKIDLVDNSKKGNDQELLSTASERMRSAVGCQFWQMFLLKPWAQAQFGTDWNNLWANGKIPKWVDKDKAADLDNKNKDMVGDAEVPLGNGNVINNWAIYQISTQTNVHSPTNHQGDKPKYTAGLANDWWRIVDVLSNYEEEEHTAQIVGGDSDSSDDSSSDSDDNTTNSGKWVKPANAKVVSGFGNRPSIGDFHNGADFGAPCGAPVYAAGDGVVKFVGKEALGGNAILIDNGDVDTLYVHMEEGTNKVKVGDKVKAGQRISSAGKTGKAFGCHLHFEVRKPSTGVWYDFNKTIDPVAFLKSKGVDLNAATDSDGSSNDGSSNDNNNSSSTTTSELKYSTPKNNPPLSQWEDWVGNNSFSRIWTSLSSVIVAGIGVLAPLIFAAMSAVYSLGISILMMFAPIMFLLACWAGRGWEIFKGWGESVINTTLKRIVTGLFMALSIAITSVAINMIQSVGWWSGMLLLIFSSLLLIKSRHRIIDAMASINISNTGFGSINSRISQRFNQGVKTVSHKTQGTAKGTARLGSSSLTGGLAAKYAGGSFKEGLVAGAKKEFNNMTYRNPNLRHARIGYDNAKKNNFTDNNNTNNDADNDILRGQEVCASCGKKLSYEEDQNGTKIFTGGRDQDGNLLCYECYSDGVDPDALAVNYRLPTNITKPEKPIDSQKQDILDKQRLANAYRGRFARESVFKKKYIQDEIYNILTKDDGHGNHAGPALLRKKLGIVVKSTEFDISDYQNRVNSELNMDVKDLSTPEIPKEIQPYINPEHLQKAWEMQNYDFVRTLYVSAFVEWFADNTGEKITNDLDQIIQDVKDGNTVEM